MNRRSYKAVIPDLFDEVIQFSDGISESYEFPIEVRLTKGTRANEYKLKWAGATKKKAYLDIPESLVSNRGMFQSLWEGAQRRIGMDAENFGREFFRSSAPIIQSQVDLIAEFAAEQAKLHGIEIELKPSKSKTQLYNIVVTRDRKKLSVQVFELMFNEERVFKLNWPQFQTNFPKDFAKSVRFVVKDEHIADGFTIVSTKEQIEARLREVAVEKESQVQRIIQRMKPDDPTRPQSNGKIIKLLWFKSITTMGKCGQDGTMHMNEVMQYLPMNLVDVIVYHEVAHLAYLNHSPNFKSLLRSWMPDYDSRYSEASTMFREVSVWLKQKDKAS